MAMKTIDAATLRQWLERGEAVVIDVREPAEHAAANIEGAVLMPLGRVERRALPDAPGRKLVLHCGSGRRSQAACEKLLAEDPGLELYNLEGGLAAWSGSGQAVQSSGRFFLPLDRQVQLVVGLAVLTGSVLAYLADPLFLLVPAFFGAGLTVAGLTGVCGLGLVMARMPWNQRAGQPAAACRLR